MAANARALASRRSIAPFGKDSAAPQFEPTSGGSIFSRGNRRQRVGRGDVAQIPAGAVHYCNPEDDDRWSDQLLLADGDWLRAVVGASGSAPEHLATVNVILYDRLDNAHPKAGAAGCQRLSRH